MASIDLPGKKTTTSPTKGAEKKSEAPTAPGVTGKAAAPFTQNVLPLFQKTSATKAPTASSSITNRAQQAAITETRGPDGVVDLRYGYCGNLIYRMQKLLKDAGVPNVNLTSRYDSEMEASVKYFQKQTRIPQTAVIDYATREKIRWVIEYGGLTKLEQEAKARDEKAKTSTSRYDPRGKSAEQGVSTPLIVTTTRASAKAQTRSTARIAAVENAKAAVARAQANLTKSLFAERAAQTQEEQKQAGEQRQANAKQVEIAQRTLEKTQEKADAEIVKEASEPGSTTIIDTTPPATNMETPSTTTSSDTPPPSEPPPTSIPETSIPPEAPPTLQLVDGGGGGGGGGAPAVYPRDATSLALPPPKMDEERPPAEEKPKFGWVAPVVIVGLVGTVAYALLKDAKSKLNGIDLEGYDGPLNSNPLLEDDDEEDEDEE